MTWWAWLLLGLFIGGPLGYLTAALMMAASQRDAM